LISSNSARQNVPGCSQLYQSKVIYKLYTYESVSIFNFSVLCASTLQLSISLATSH